MKLAESKDINQAMELQSQHVRKQMETFVHQLEEMRDLTAQIIQEANPATRTDMSSGSDAGSRRHRKPPRRDSISGSGHSYPS